MRGNDNNNNNISKAARTRHVHGKPASVTTGLRDRTYVRK